MTIDFDKLMPDVRDVPAPPGSQNAQLLALPQQRKYTHDMKGKLLYFPRTDQIMVPYEMPKGGGWYAVVVFNGQRAPKHDGTNGWKAGTFVYPPNGYSLYVSDLEMQTAIELVAVEEYAVEVLVKGRTESIELPAGNYETAQRIAKANQAHDSGTQIIQTINFGPAEGAWDVAE